MKSTLSMRYSAKLPNCKIKIPVTFSSSACIYIFNYTNLRHQLVCHIQNSQCNIRCLNAAYTTLTSVFRSDSESLVLCLFHLAIATATTVTARNVMRTTTRDEMVIPAIAPTVSCSASTGYKGINQELKMWYSHIPTAMHN